MKDEKGCVDGQIAAGAIKWALRDAMYQGKRIAEGEAGIDE